MKNETILLNKEDVNNPLHPNLWDSWLETLGVDSEATEVCLNLSTLDHNKKSKPIKHIPLCWKCASKVEKPNDDNSFTLVGCKECNDIHNYSDAKKLCPVLSKK